MVQRSLFHPDQLDSNGSYNFAQLVIDGYSGGNLQDGYLMGLILTDGYKDGAETLRINAHNGAISQIGTGEVTLNGNVHITNDIIIDGNLSIQGTTTTIDTEQMIVTDPITIINASGNEILSDWTGLAAHDTDGYNRIGWIFDGYWAISSTASQPNIIPDRAIAFLGDGYINGDLSSTINGNSGANKIGITTINGINANNVQIALESLDNNINILEYGTKYNQWVINTNTNAIIDEDVCLVLSGSNGINLIDGYFCLITDSVSKFQFQIYEDSIIKTTDLHIGTESQTSAADAILTFNAGNGVDSYQAVITLNENGLTYLANTHYFAGNVNPSVDCNYQLGNEDYRFLDAYFYFFTPSNYIPANNYSLESHLKAIDSVLNITLRPKRGVYVIKIIEALIDRLDTSRTQDQGDNINLTTWTDEEFRDYAYIYLDGQLLDNDPVPADNNLSVQNSIARKTDNLSVLLFAGDIRRNVVVQIVDMR